MVLVYCHFGKATISCFCSFDLSCVVPEKDNFIKKFYIVLLNNILFLTTFVLDLVYCVDYLSWKAEVTPTV